MARPKSEARLRAEATARSHTHDMAAAAPTVRARSTIAQQDFAGVKADLERMSVAGNDMINRRDFDLTYCHDVMQHSSPDFKVYWDYWLGPKRAANFQEIVSSFRRKTEEDPAYHFRLLQVETDLDLGKGKAIVYMHVEVTGLANVERMEGLTCN